MPKKPSGSSTNDNTEQSSQTQGENFQMESSHKCWECKKSGCRQHKLQCERHQTYIFYRPDCSDARAFPRRCRLCFKGMDSPEEARAKRLEREEKKKGNFSKTSDHDSFFSQTSKGRKPKRKGDDSDSDTSSGKSSCGGALSAREPLQST